MSKFEQPSLFPEYALGVPEMRRELDAFVANPGLDRLVRAFSGEPLPLDPLERLNVLQQFASDHWDIRGAHAAGGKGSERQAINWADALSYLTDEQRQEIEIAGRELGMAETSAPENRYPDWLLIPGGANEVALNRLAIGLSTVKPKSVAALVSARQLPEAEKKRVSSWAPNAQTEYDLACAAYELMPNARLIGETIEERSGDPWRIRMYKFTFDGEVKEAFVIGAPAVIHNEDGTTRRANSRDNFSCFADGVGVSRGVSVAIATTGLYVPQQHLNAIEELAPKGFVVETFGHSHHVALGGTPRYPAQYVQEAKAAVDAAVNLRKAIDRATQS